MSSLDRGRYVIALGDTWRLYQTSPPQGWEMLGVVERGGERGALARSPSGLYAQINAGSIRALNQAKVAASIRAEAHHGT